jgi:hypothetical protein
LGLGLGLGLSLGLGSISPHEINIAAHCTGLKSSP